MNKMTLDDVQALKAETEKQILEALAAFQKATGLTPEFIDLQSMRIESGKTILVGCEIEVKL